MAHQPSQSDRAPNEGLTARAEAALTHPATLLALATLLVNDLVFKWLWPGAWITGKLSDLAWVIFAPPLLALPLTFFARRNQTAQRAAWAIAYIGLPLLYAAYNTFEPLHEFILNGLSLFSESSRRSPFDPSDSFVIPFGIAVAIWVWRGAKVNRLVTQLRFGILVAAIASVASLATGFEQPRFGISSLSQNQEGDVVAKEYYDREFFLSRDGGLTWVSARDSLNGDDSIDWIRPTAETPNGIYSLDGPNVIRTVDGIPEILHSTVIVSARSDRTIVALTTDLNLFLTKHIPLDIHYDAISGNLIVAMGRQGVLVGTPDGQWQRIGVGNYKPIDHSLLARAKLLMQSDELLFIALALTIASLGFALTMADLSLDAKHSRYLGTLWMLLICGASTVPMILYGEFNSYVSYDAGFVVLGAAALGFVSTISLFAVSLTPHSLKVCFAVFLAALGMMLAIEIVFLMWISGYLSITIAKVASIVLVWSIAIVLYAYARRGRLARPTPEVVVG